MIIYKLEPEYFGSLFGYRTYKDGEKQDWDASGPKTIESCLYREIQRQSPDGGKIIRGGKTIDVPGCPTNHANVVEDYMGGSVCKDCRAVW